MTTNGNHVVNAAPKGKVKSPSFMAHVALRTGDLPLMQRFYADFLGGSIVWSGEMLSFITYDDEHHRIALIGVPGTAPKIPTTSGLEHISFTFDSLKDLVTAYQQRKAIGIVPVWCTNHGPTTSMYYKDPDGNFIETQVDNFDTAEEATAFMQGPLYNENPIGTDFDPEELAARLDGGEDERVIKTRIEIGARGVPNFAGMGSSVAAWKANLQ